MYANMIGWILIVGAFFFIFDQKPIEGLLFAILAKLMWIGDDISHLHNTSEEKK